MANTMRRMSGGERQSIVIARAAYWGKHLFIMDGPTAAPGVWATASVARLVRRGVTVARRWVDASVDDLIVVVTAAQPGHADV